MLNELIQRYSLGDRTSSWNELSKIRISDLTPSEQARLTDFARGVMKTLASNIYSLSERLKSEGFRFGEGENAIVPSSPKTLEMLDRAEAGIGKVPLILRCFYEVFEDVSFSQETNQYYDHNSRFFHFGTCCALIHHSPKYALDRWEYAINYHKRPDVLRSLGRSEPIEIGRFFETGLAYSGGDPDSIILPADSLDCEYYIHPVLNTPVLFLEHMRMTLKFSGFLGLAIEPADNPNRILAEELSKDLIPF